VSDAAAPADIARDDRQQVTRRIRSALWAIEHGDEAGWRTQVDALIAWRNQPLLQGLVRLSSEHPGADGSARLLVALADGQSVESVIPEHAFLHYCHCGQWGLYGFEVRMRAGKMGTWFCGKHKPGGIDASEDRTERAART